MASALAATDRERRHLIADHVTPQGLIAELVATALGQACLPCPKSLALLAKARASLADTNAVGALVKGFSPSAALNARGAKVLEPTRVLAKSAKVLATLKSAAESAAALGGTASSQPTNRKTTQSTWRMRMMEILSDLRVRLEFALFVILGKMVVGVYASGELTLNSCSCRRMLVSTNF